MPTVLLIVTLCASSSVDGYMRSEENTASSFRVRRCSAFKDWKVMIKRRIKGKLRHTFIRVKQNIYYSHVYQECLLVLLIEAESLEEKRRLGDGKWTV
jgi:hypothetical protein